MNPLARAALFCLVLASPACAVELTTSGAGGSQPFSNSQPSLTMNYLVRLEGTQDEIGEVGVFAANFAPRGWAEAAGQLLSVEGNQDLFSKLGTTFGGDGENSFALPDLRGRVAIGAGQGAGLPDYSLGQKVGGETVGPPLLEHTHSTTGGYVIGSAGTGASSTHSNMQPSLALTPVIALTGVFPPFSGPLPDDGDAIAPSGAQHFLSEITWLAHDEVPDGWAKAEGQLLSIAQNDALYSLLGTTFGGDGETTFALPDLRGRTPIGEGSGPGISQQSWGEKSGTDEETLTTAHMPNHAHQLPGNLGQTNATGGSQPQSNMQPSLAVYYSIADTGIYPSQSSPEEDDLGGGADPFYASVMMLGANYTPRGYARTDGQLMPIAQNTALFSLLGTTYGGDGRSTFGAPDLRGRAVVGRGNGPGLTNRVLGSKYGAETSVLTLANLASHAHTVGIPGDYNNDGQVDSVDYAVWRENLGAPADTLPNDTAGGMIGQAQFELWKNYYGASGIAAGIADQAPEPAAWTALFAACLVARYRFTRA